MRFGVFALDFFRASSKNFLLKIVASAGGFNFIQSWIEPKLNYMPIFIPQLKEVVEKR